MKKLIVLFAIISCTSCYENTKQNLFSVSDKMVGYAPKDSGVKYFPADTLEYDRDYLKKWADEVLFNLHEPVLKNYSGDGEFIRFVWLRTFDNAIVIRVNKFDDTVYANIKELKIKSFEGEIPKILKDTVVLLDESKWQEMLSPLEKNNYWNALYDETSLGKDGASWFLECHLEKRYHVINRWDDGYLTSKELKNFAMPLINLGNNFVPMRSSR